MQAVVKAKAEPGLWLEQVPVPEVAGDDVLIRVLKTGICGTDVHIYNWDAWAQKTIPVPLVIGHEFVGRTVEVGANVKDFHPGEVVSGEGHVVCGRCRNCLAGRRHLCKDTRGIGVTPPPSGTCSPTCATAARSPCSASPSARWPSTGTPSSSTR